MDEIDVKNARKKDSLYQVAAETLTYRDLTTGDIFTLDPKSGKIKKITQRIIETGT